MRQGGRRTEEERTNNCKMAECIVVTKKKNPMCKLRIEDVKIMQVINFLNSIVTKDGKCSRLF